MIELDSNTAERALLVASGPRGTDLDARLDELERLADTAGADVVGREAQYRARPSPRLLLGTGKVAELAKSAEAASTTLVIFDDALSPVQGRNLERELGIRVMDRTELILDIFASRARTKEAKLQVELAQLDYLLPRLARMWTHLSRIRGGIGLRGPGETQIETDRRLIRQRMTRLRSRLQDRQRHRAVLRQGRGRRGVPTAALVGYTNAGKSSLLRALSGAEVLIEDRLFATLDTTTREIFVPPSGRVRIIDTVGFIRHLPHSLVASFRATLEEAAAADVLLHVIDASHAEWEHQVEVVDQTLADLDLQAQPVVHVFNKMDLIGEAAGFVRQTETRFPNAAYIAASENDLDELWPPLRRIISGTAPRDTRRSEPVTDPPEATA